MRNCQPLEATQGPSSGWTDTGTVPPAVGGCSARRGHEPSRHEGMRGAVSVCQSDRSRSETAAARVIPATGLCGEGTVVGPVTGRVAGRGEEGRMGGARQTGRAEDSETPQRWMPVPTQPSQRTERPPREGSPPREGPSREQRTLGDDDVSVWAHSWDQTHDSGVGCGQWGRLCPCGAGKWDKEATGFDDPLRCDKPRISNAHSYAHTRHKVQKVLNRPGDQETLSPPTFLLDWSVAP